MLISNLLRKLDMQDLMVFVAVYEQSSVTEVSEALCVSQSTVSYCLKKLRMCFDDELFINTRNRMWPTKKAATMYGHVLKILKSINICHSGLHAFDPTQKEITFNVCAPEYFELLILPSLLKRFISSCFPVIVNVQKFHRDIPIEELIDGRFDLVICFGPNFHSSSENLKSQVLLADDLVCVVDKNAAPAEGEFSLDSFVARQHIFPTPWTSDTNMVDGWLSKRAYSSRIAARANSYVAALYMIPGTDFVLTLPRRIQMLISNEDKFAHCQPPTGLPNFTLDMLWNENLGQDSVNHWFREQIVSVCAQDGLL
ncbi:Transcript ional regulator, LysR family [Pseudomonas cannabina pv. alisalensis]|uniref:LysR family transcriptional regulator n=2 Tax=Pseudomonas cannabina TaxID=86840 RepID=A0ABS1XBF4_PSEC1|nr:LysR family transcriptional regulator [Pseudomonas cannabina]KPW15768.1 Transcript ional regulator, LysR family [Pseudomonas cannabina pv. alisalensis]MBM0138823.1 LysR family transcriptional regulator [Pseudomonas cannabina pv. alisalensis]RMN74899.1 Transcript ional regulator, LysR family [Pseudomonas cannabina]RMN79167.1 Transcript ional regulator, LysR family [Pseudomonas cannabina pv. alisalensis]RMO00244.1 putative LysR family regulatory protein [Pseudomonas cannabina]